jgi:inorganic pyrophosphatase/exopolyphosphatase
MGKQVAELRKSELSRMNDMGYAMTTYANPDADGVASALGLVELFRTRYEEDAGAYFFGRLNEETEVLLDRFPAKGMFIGKRIPCSCKIFLVDTHSVQQLPPSAVPERVVEIIDHHPDGTPEAFPRAIIQNEKVGAASTLVAERFRKAGVLPSVATSGLLAGGIYSNTLAFSAPSTHHRDRAAFQWAGDHGGWSEELEGAISLSKLAALREDKASALFSDSKIVIAGDNTYMIFQFEATGLWSCVEPDEVVELFLRRAKLEQHVVIGNFVDVVKKESLVTSSRLEVLDRLATALGGIRVSDNAVIVKRILQRKTDIVPNL